MPTREEVLAEVAKNGLALEYASAQLKSDKLVAMVAVKQNGFALAYVAPEWKNDLEIVLEALQECKAKEHVSDTLKTAVMFKAQEIVQKTVPKIVPEEIQDLVGEFLSNDKNQKAVSLEGKDEGIIKEIYDRLFKEFVSNNENKEGESLGEKGEGAINNSQSFRPK